MAKDRENEKRADCAHGSLPFCWECGTDAGEDASPFAPVDEVPTRFPVEAARESIRRTQELAQKSEVPTVADQMPAVMAEAIRTGRSPGEIEAEQDLQALVAYRLQADSKVVQSAESARTPGTGIVLTHTPSAVERYAVHRYSFVDTAGQPQAILYSGGYYRTYEDALRDFDGLYRERPEVKAQKDAMDLITASSPEDKVAAADKLIGQNDPEVISIAVTWAGMLPYLLELLTNGDAEGQRQAREELQRMAKAADMANSMASRS